MLLLILLDIVDKYTVVNRFCGFIIISEVIFFLI